jgi:putative addiction module component (TIGR02574 family)
MKSAAPKSLTPDELLDQVLRLPKEQRRRLADQIWKSVENEGWPADLQPAWQSEIARRLKSIKDGPQFC